MGKSREAKRKTSAPDRPRPRLSWPSVSFAIATYNSGRTIRECLSSIKSQAYPAPIEIVIADGGSRDETLPIAQEFGARILSVPRDLQNAEYNKGVAANAAKNEILAMIDHDNILPHKEWLKRMVAPLLQDPEIFGSGVWRFAYERGMNILDRYFALIGTSDTLTFFFGKSAHQSYLYDGFHLRGKLISDRGNYFKVELEADKLPALGGNGSILWRRLLAKARSDPTNFFHIDIHVDLVRRGYTKYAFVKETIIHRTLNSLFPFLARRRYFIEKYHFADRSKRRYSIYEPGRDRLALLAYIFYSLSIVLPTLDAMRGFLKVPDPAWFIHPLMCLGTLFVYGMPTAREEVKRVVLGK